MSRLAPLVRPASSHLLVPPSLPPLSRPGDSNAFENLFIHALVAASSCRQHRQTHKWAARSTPRAAASCSQIQSPSLSVRSQPFSTRTPQRQTAVAAAPEPEISRDEYKELVNTYPDFWAPRKPSQQQAKFSEQTKKGHFPLASRLVLTPEQELLPHHVEREVLKPENKEHAAQIRRLTALSRRPLGDVAHTTLWQAYEALPSPRPRYLHDRLIMRLFRQLAWTEFKTSPGGMQRYFALLNECVGEGVPLNTRIWNSAISFAGRWLTVTANSEVKAAVETWMRMEQSGHNADHVTFNILFQVAIRAGRWALAETIFNEIKERKMPLNRYFRVTVIYYAGVRRDGDGVRQAFRDLVNAGEIVDTAVMNCVILSLFRSGEAPAAENVFLRMKSLHEQKFGIVSPEHWRARRELGIILDKTGERLRRERQIHESSFFGAPFSSDQRREEIQKGSPIAPDALTYRLLIKHHAYTSGDLAKVRDYLAEMREGSHPIHGSVYLHVLRGFYTHGGYAYSSWNRRSLEEFWDEILSAIPPVFSAHSPRPASSSSLLPPDSTQLPEREDHDLDRSDMLGAMMAEQAHTTSRDDPDQEGSETGPPASSSSSFDSPPLHHTDEVATDAEIPELERAPYVTPAFALAVVHAFYKCAGCARMLQAWEEIQLRWTDGSEEDRMRVQQVVDRMVAEDSVFVVQQ